MKQKKKMAAALAAVTAYIKTEQEAQMALAAQAAQAQAGPKGMPEMNLWGLSGRQAQMQMRNLVQMKSFHGAKLR